MTGVFVSYAREDAAKAKAIATQIEQAGFEVWFDERIHSGSEFTREIEDALASAAIVLVLWSAHSVNSAWVRDEAAEGRDSGRLVPVMLDDSRPPIGFRQFQSTDMSGWSGRGRPKQIREVIEAIRAKLGSTAPTAIAELRPSVSWTSTIAWSAAVLGVMIAALLIYLLVGRPAQAPDAAPSVALLPFTTESSDPEIRQIASATHDAVAHTLAQGELSIRVIDSLPKDGTPAADFVLTGQLSSASDKIVATVRMDETTHHFVVYSYQFEGSRKEAQDFAERVGAQVAGQLSWTAPLLAVERKHPSDSAVTASLLQASSTGLAGSGTLHDYENSRRLAQSAPNSPLAQSSFAINTAFALDQLPREERAEAVVAGRQAADRALAIAPEFGDAYFAWCQLQNPAALAACEDKLRGGMRAARMRR